MRTLPHVGHEVLGIDVKPGAFTHVVGSITDRAFVERSIRGADAVVHTATLHKPHIGTHSREDFVATNVNGTLNLLEEAVAAGVTTFVFTSTTSAFGRALTGSADSPATWITEDVAPVPKNIYGVTKVAAEDLCELFHRSHRLACMVLRTSRFFPEPDDDVATRRAYDETNAKVNELLYRRVDIEDVVAAHLQALTKATTIGFARYIITATTPFTRDDLAELGVNAPAVVNRYVPEYTEVYRRQGWRMFPRIDRVYVNRRARTELGWQPQYDFGGVIERIAKGEDPRSPLARAIGAKGYHSGALADGSYPLI